MLFAAHCSLLTTTYFLLTSYYFLLTSYYFLLTTYCALLTPHYTLLDTYYSLITTHYSLPTTHYLLPTTHYSLLTTHYSLLTAHYHLPYDLQGASQCCWRGSGAPIHTCLRPRHKRFVSAPRQAIYQRRGLPVLARAARSGSRSNHIVIT